MKNIDVLSKTYCEELKKYEEIEKPDSEIALTEFNITIPKIEEKTQLTTSYIDWWPLLSSTDCAMLFTTLEMEMISSGMNPH